MSSNAIDYTFSSVEQPFPNHIVLNQYAGLEA